MFKRFNKKVPSRLKVMGHNLDVVSITRDGSILFTGEVAKKYGKDHLEGKIFETAFRCKRGNPYFAYYVCPKYYTAVAGFGGGSISDVMFAEEFRTAASQAVGAFLVKCLRQTLKLRADQEIVSFSHNRAHTNVLAYVSSIDAWAPVRHNDTEDEDASERKVAAVNAGRAQISDVISVGDLSPSD